MSFLSEEEIKKIKNNHKKGLCYRCEKPTHNHLRCIACGMLLHEDWNYIPNEKQKCEFCLIVNK